MKYSSMSPAELGEEKLRLETQYHEICAKGLKLDMSRGKPSKAQLDLSEGLLTVLSENEDCLSAGGVDCRNYGGLDGLPEAKQMFSDILEIPVQNIIVGGNSSLNMMFDTLSRAMLFGMNAECGPWVGNNVKFLCPAPGYDRHFSVCETLGIEMIPVPMHEDGPDMDLVERLCAEDASIKGIWCVPKYSNPQGYVYSDETVRRFAALRPAAKDFRIMWDNAYIIHSFVGDPARQLNLFEEAKRLGNEDQVIIFCSTSKITYPGAGVAAMAMSDANIAFAKKVMTMQTIGPDKINQLRHVKFFGGSRGLAEHMKKHADLLRPKFEIVFHALETLRDADICRWTTPTGGYFLSVDTMPGCAKRVYALAKQAGVTLTSVGATFPYGRDPEDTNLRIAPSFPINAELAQAAEVLCLCIRLASVEKLLNA